jgi:hypothetical protein
MAQLVPLAERQRPKVGAIEPENVERHVGGGARAPKEVVELWSAGFVGRDYLSIENSVINVEQGGKLVAKPAEAVHRVAVARYETAAAMLKIGNSPEAIVFAVKEPPGGSSNGSFRQIGAMG